MFKNVNCKVIQHSSFHRMCLVQIYNLFFILGGLCMTKPESIAVVIEFLTLVCAEGRMRDWLGEEGRGFWLPLLSLLSNRPIESPSASASRYVCYVIFK